MKISDIVPTFVISNYHSLIVKQKHDEKTTYYVGMHYCIVCHILGFPYKGQSVQRMRRKMHL